MYKRNQNADQCHRKHRRLRTFRNRRNAIDPPFDQWRIGYARTGDDNQSHLHGKAEQFPKPFVPILNHLHRSLVRQRDPQAKSDKSQCHCKDTRIWHVL